VQDVPDHEGELDKRDASGPGDAAPEVGCDSTLALASSCPSLSITTHWLTEQPGVLLKRALDPVTVLLRDPGLAHEVLPHHRVTLMLQVSKNVNTRLEASANRIGIRGPGQQATPQLCRGSVNEMSQSMRRHDDSLIQRAALAVQRVHVRKAVKGPGTSALGQLHCESGFVPDLPPASSHDEPLRDQ
jgi:hypothetical protein